MNIILKPDIKIKKIVGNSKYHKNMSNNYFIIKEFFLNL